MRICEVPECGMKHVARGYCSKHYAQRKQAGEFLDTRPKGRVGCLAQDCDVKKHHSKGYCQKHYSLFCKWGESLKPPIKPEKSPCWCGQPATRGDMCHNHYQIWWWNNRGGDAEKRTRREVVGYEAMHYRLRVDRGKASEFPCVECQSPAMEWSLNHDAETLVSVKGGRIGSLYSLNIMDYSPRCKKCHDTYDVEFRKQNRI